MRPGRPAACTLRLLLCAAAARGAAALAVANPNPAKFLIVSAPGEGKVAYMRVRSGGSIGMLGRGVQSSMQTLVGSGLEEPQGLAVEQTRRLLLVADPKAQQIYSYPLRSYEQRLSVGPRSVLAQGVEARWVAVDGVGDIFFTDESRNQILKITRAQALKGQTMPRVVYDGTSLAQVSAPGGVAVDSFHAYWANKLKGTEAGSVVRGPETPRVLSQGVAASAVVEPLARNSEKSYGVCLAWNNVYYTQPESSIFVVKKEGGAPAVVSSRLTNPRGCAWDGDGTVYVADRGAGAVYSFAGNMQTVGAALLSKTVDFEDAFGVAVYSGASRSACWVAFVAAVAWALA